MNIQEVLQSMSERLSATASAKTVFGDPVSAGDRTVIPAAQVRYGFGGGAGRPKGEATTGGGGGGRVVAKPCGALEVTPAGTRFIDFEDRRRTGAAFAIGFILGVAAMAMAGSRRVVVVKRTIREGGSSGPV